ncbi:uncharacterized protein MYCGRDRAFT_56118 [Zymoseptoria tritici IPO323]|uniref:Uncharacterized protein n=2 Tax=Zymoseptoria tritici TaxID=1047171 RepID=F9X5C7_ZYMTI|nr:uncharacterized protein MYCGRDRAFT_56118 [Zymoseptoria tritici IPO323]EGP88593.1 hypothetical protein MYCGRDRAFT_56118 [Zymoseptoria tritici IPO323]
MSNTDSPSLWRQEPSPEVDKLWEDHWDSNPMLMPVEDVVKIGHDPDYVVRWASGARHPHRTIVSNHAHHLLHCLDELRKSVWTSHYWPDGNMNPFHRNHQAHCIDLLRQDLMCRAPRNVVSWIWMESEPAPQPNFNVSMKCANDGWDDMWSWWKERQLTKEQLGTEEPAKPAGVKEWPASSAQKKENEALKELCSQPGVKCTQAGEPVDFSGH